MTNENEPIDDDQISFLSSDPDKSDNTLREIHRLLNSAVNMADNEDVPLCIKEKIWDVFESLQKYL